MHLTELHTKINHIYIFIYDEGHTTIEHPVIFFLLKLVATTILDSDTEK